MQYYATYVLGIKDVEIHPLTHVGRLVHKAFEDTLKWNKGSLLPVDPLQFLPALLEQYKVQEFERVAREFVAKAVEWGYLKNLDVMVGCECKFDFQIESGIKVTGIIDRLDFHPDSNATVMDLKTGKSTCDEKELAQDWQARIYNIAARTLIPEIKTCTLTFWYLRKQRVTVLKTREDAAFDKLKLQNIANQIRDTEPKCNPSALCRWCSYNECPSFAAGKLKMRLKKLWKK